MGEALSYYLESGEYFDCIYFPGVKLNGLKEKIEAYCDHTTPTAIYIMAGINNVTRRDYLTKKVFLPYQSSTALRDDMMDRYVDLVKFCTMDMGINDVIILPLTGMCMSAYNKEHGWNVRQRVLDRGMLMLNEHIITMNAANNLHTPLTHHYIHRCVGGGRPVRHMYSRLWDGLHPRGDTLNRWAHNLVSAARYNGHF